MAMIMSDADVQGVLHFAIRNTATILGIRDPDWKTPRELLREIEAADLQTYQLLETFCTAYRDWYNYVRDLDNLGKHGFLDALEQAKLFELEKSRDSARTSILARLRILKQ